MKNFPRLFGMFFGGFIVFNILIECLVSCLRLKYIMYLAIGLFIFLYAFFYPRIKQRCNRPLLIAANNIVKTGIVFFIITFSVVSGVIYEKSAQYPENNSDAVIVLGAGLYGEKVSLPLAHRLDSAADYYFDNPEAVIVVSGGQGPTELVTEAYAMKKYLVEKGVPADRIIEEGLSTRTIENFEYSKLLLDEYFDYNDYRVTYVTNGTHVFRSGLISEQVGLETESIGAANTPFLAVNQYMYEYFALIKYFALDYC